MHNRKDHEQDKEIQSILCSHGPLKREIEPQQENIGNGSKLGCGAGPDKLHSWFVSLDGQQPECVPPKPWVH